MLVVWLHASEVFVTLPSIAVHGTAWFDAADLLGAGRIGVVAFFAISGYVIVPTVRGPRWDGTRDFLVKRFFRLFPAYWVAIAVASVTVWWMFDRSLTLAIVAANATMVPLEFREPQMMGHFWTLEVELIFYGLILLLFWTRTLANERVIAWFVVALSIAWPVLMRTAGGRLLVDRNLAWSFLGYFLTVMFWGAMCRTRRDRPSGAWSPKGEGAFLVVSVLVFARPLIALAFGSTTVNREDWRGTLLGLGLFLIATRIPDRHARRVVWLGTISYSLYLLHPAIFYPIFRLVSRTPGIAHWPLAVYVAVSIAASVAGAAVSHAVVEKPANAFARRVVARRRDASATVDAAGMPLAPDRPA